MKQIFFLTLLLLSGFAFACGGGSAESEALENPNDTPTEAYKRLFAAVKSKNPEAIRKEMSARSLALVKQAAAQQKKSEEEVLANGFTSTTFAPTLPEMRDERVKGKMGAVEVWNVSNNSWEDVPFIREKDGWKLAYGDAFGGTWTQPGKGQAQRDREATNSANNTNNLKVIPIPSNVNVQRVPLPPPAQRNANLK